MQWEEKKNNLNNVEFLSKKLGISPCLSRILFNRGLNTPEQAFYFLYGDIENTLSPYLFQDMKKAVSHIRKLIHDKKPIYVVGDKDVDGITGTAILYHFFHRMGVPSVHYNLPIDKESYGFSDRIYEHILEQEEVDTVLTVDCGIKENTFIDLLNSKNIQTIITDHHTPPEKLPKAHSIINPHLEPYEMVYLSGAAVAFKLVQGLYFSYHSFYNKKILFLIEDKEIKGLLTENFVPEKKEIRFSTETELHQFLDSHPGLMVISENHTLSKLKRSLNHPNIQVFDIFKIASHKLNIPASSLNLKKLSELLSIYYEPAKPHRNLFSLMKKIFFKYYLKIEEKLNSLLQFATLGTVCDYMPLNTVENHIIVKAGLNLINQEMPYYLKLMVPKEKVEMKDIGFGIGPLLNSSGRLGQPQVSLNFLLEEEKDKVDSIYTRLKSLNDQRKKIGEKAYKEAINHIELYQKDEDVLVYHSANIIQGLTGIIATKIVNSYKKTSFVFSVNHQDNEIIGSGRSFGNFDILSIVQKCAGLFRRFGGHKKACGMTFNIDLLDEIIENIRENTKQYLETCGMLEFSLFYDIEIKPEQIQMQLLRELKKLSPYGPENEEPVFFSQNVSPSQIKLFGSANKHLRFRIKENPSVDFIGWKMADKEDFVRNSRLDIVYTLQENVYNYSVYMQAVILEMREHAG